MGKIVGFFEVLVFEPEDEGQALSAVMSVSMPLTQRADGLIPVLSL
jgi:hypothetical protein